jgi:hypothetical protein
MAECGACRREVADMQDQARVLRGLRAPEEIDPAPGFYARVIEKIVARKRASFLYAFLDPALTRRLIYASLTAVVLLGSLLVYWEGLPALDDSSLMAIIAAETPAGEMVGADPAHDRQTMLLTLASYQE